MDKYNLILETVENIIAPGSRCTISKTLESAIEENLIEKYGYNWREKKDIFSSAFNNIRKNFNVNTYKEDVPYVYSMYYLFMNVPKVQLVLIELMKKVKLHKRIDILDIGAAVGTSSAAMLDLFTLINNICDLYEEEQLINKVEIDSIEGSKENIDLFEKNIKVFKDKLSKFINTDFIKINNPTHCNVNELECTKKYDLIIISNILNELTYEEQFNLMTKAKNMLSKNGNILIIEPATKKNTLALNRLKIQMVSNMELNVIAPCSICSDCKECWNFRTSNIVKGKIYSYIDKLYEEKNLTKFDDYYNNRLKWSYCILSNYVNENKIKPISKYNLGNNEKITLYSIDNKSNGNLCFCDGIGNKVFIKSIEYKNFKYGDCVEIQKCKLEQNENYEIQLDDESVILNSNLNYSRKKFRYKNIKKENINFILNRLWGFSELRDGQFEIIAKALEGEDILGILPTGAGKSICYQIPAILSNGVSIVVSPLKSLIKDQVNNLNSIGFEFVDFIDSSRSKSEKDIILKRFRNGSLKMLYVAPERLQMLEFQIELKKALKGFNIDYFIIDEAHCASEWGHDFRPAYLKLKDVSDSLGDCNIVAVTATASPKVKDDILDIFNISNDNVIKSKSLDRNEISLSVINIDEFEDKDSKLLVELTQKIPEILQYDSLEGIHDKGAGIIFTIYGEGKGSSTRPFSTTYINECTKQWGIDSKCYHSKLPETIKIDIQDKYKDNEFPLLVSTKGFGMGIDKPNIRYIIHMCYPNSLEAYYQEAGRGGRDKVHAHSVIIAKDRIEKCSKEYSDINTFEPPCVNEWTCNYTGGNKCDYGMQAKFISNEYPSAFIMEKKIRNFVYNYLLRAYERRSSNLEFSLLIPNKDSSEYQNYLYYLQKFNIISNYNIIKYYGGKIVVGVEIIKEIDVRRLDNIIKEIILKMQEFKQQKYNMLHGMLLYVENKEECRRQHLMDYFGESITYGDTGCCFCDNEGISLEKRNTVKSSRDVIVLYSDLQKCFDNKVFNYYEIKNLLQEAEEKNSEDSIKIRALRHLEDYIDSAAALYISSYIAIKSDIRNSYARNQVLQLVDVLYKNNEVEQITKVINDFYYLDNDLIVDLFKSSNKLQNDAILIQSLVDGDFESEIKKIAYKTFVSKKLSEINKVFK